MTKSAMKQRELLDERRLDAAVIRNSVMTEVFNHVPHLIGQINLMLPLDVLLAMVRCSSCTHFTCCITFHCCTASNHMLPFKSRLLHFQLNQSTAASAGSFSASGTLMRPCTRCATASLASTATPRYAATAAPARTHSCTT